MTLFHFNLIIVVWLSESNQLRMCWDINTGF